MKKLQTTERIKGETRSSYIEVSIMEKPMLMLVDTGSTHTLLSYDYASRMGFLSTDLDMVKSLDAYSANGNKIQCYGQLTTKIKIGTIIHESNIIISDILEDGILGMDFILLSGLQLDFSQMTAKTYKESIPLVSKNGHRLSTRCLTNTSQIIPPLSECLITLDKQHPTEDIEGMIEPLQHQVFENENVLISRCLVKDDALYTRIANLSDQPVTIKPNQAICRFITSSMLQVEKKENQPTPQHVTVQQEIPEHLQPLLESLPEDISENTKSMLQNLLTSYQDVFSKGPDDMGRTNLIQHDIKIKNSIEPTRLPPYRVGYHANKEIEKHVQELLDKDIIEPTTSPYSSPVILVGKKDGTSRFVIDYRKLNKNTIVDAYPLPRIDDNLEALGGSKFFSIFDLLSGFWQVPLSPDARDKAAFCTRSGLYTWKSMPMGLAGSPSTFERLMEIVMKGLQWQTMLVYLDDIICFSTTEQEHIDRLKQILERLRNANLKIKVSKSKLLQKEVKYLGHIITRDGIQTDPDKIKAISNITIPRNVSEVRSFLGLAGYYRRYCQNYATIVKPICDLLRKRIKFEWTPECSVAFDTLKNSLIKSTTLAYPDFNKPFILDTDCSGTAMGAILAQENVDKEEQPIAYFSKNLNNAQKNYPITKQEMCAMVEAIRHFRPYLYGAKFVCRVDHHSLIWLTNLKNPTGILARWLETLAQYQFTVIHRPGRLHTNADGLSRLQNNEEVGKYKNVSKEINHSEVSIRSISISNDEFIQQQNADPNLVPVLQAIKTGSFPDINQLRLYNRETRFYFGKVMSLQVDQGVLTENLNQSKRIIVPTMLQKELVVSFHSDDHAGTDRTLSRISQYYYWYGISSTVKQVVQACLTCQQNKTSKIEATSTKTLNTGATLDQVSIDLVGPFPLTTSGNTTILVAIDHYSKWAEAYPLSQATAENCAKKLYENFFTRFGFPLILHSNRGLAFTSSIFKELCLIGQTKQTFTAPYHPTGNAVCERMIGTLTTMIRTKIQDTTHEWDTIIDTVMMAYRATPHASTKFSPNHMMLGRNIKLPQVLCPKADPIPTTEYIEKINSELHEVYKKVNNLQNEKTNFDPVIHKAYATGDRVWILNKKSNINKPAKLSPRYSGPYEISKVLDYDTYIVKLNNGNERIEHHARLKLCYTPPNPLQNDKIDNINDNSNDDEDDNNNNNASSSSVTNLASTAKATTDNKRTRRLPTYLKDYELS